MRAMCCVTGPNAILLAMSLNGGWTLQGYAKSCLMGSWRMQHELRIRGNEDQIPWRQEQLEVLVAVDQLPFRDMAPRSIEVLSLD
jgi:hypothetical protein